LAERTGGEIRRKGSKKPPAKGLRSIPQPLGFVTLLQTSRRFRWLLPSL
jgi:hypothetical protein